MTQRRPLVLDANGDYAEVGAADVLLPATYGMASFTTGDVPGPLDAPNGTWSPRWTSFVELSANTALGTGSTTLQATTLQITSPFSRAGTFLIDVQIGTSVSGTATIAWGIAAAGGLGALTRLHGAWEQAVTATTVATAWQIGSVSAGGTGVASGSRASGVNLWARFTGTAVVASGVAFTVMASRSAQTLTLLQGSFFRLTQIA